MGRVRCCIMSCQDWGQSVRVRSHLSPGSGEGEVRKGQRRGWVSGTLQEKWSVQCQVNWSQIWAVWAQEAFRLSPKGMLGSLLGVRDPASVPLLYVAPGEVKVPELDEPEGQGSGCQGHRSTRKPTSTVYSPWCRLRLGVPPPWLCSPWIASAHPSGGPVPSAPCLPRLPSPCNAGTGDRNQFEPYLEGLSSSATVISPQTHAVTPGSSQPMNSSQSCQPPRSGHPDTRPCLGVVLNHFSLT